MNHNILNKLYAQMNLTPGEKDYIQKKDSRIRFYPDTEKKDLEKEVRKLEYISAYARIVEGIRRTGNNDLSPAELEVSQICENEIFNSNDIYDLFGSLLYVQGNAAAGTIQDIKEDLDGRSVKYGERIATADSLEFLDTRTGNTYSDFGKTLEKSFLKRFDALPLTERQDLAEAIRALHHPIFYNQSHRGFESMRRVCYQGIPSEIKQHELNSEYFDRKYRYHNANENYLRGLYWEQQWHKLFYQTEATPTPEDGRTM